MQQVAVVSASPFADFNSNPHITNTEEPVNFTDQSSGSSSIPDTVQLVDWLWDFYYPAVGANDSISTLQNSSHFYGDTGTFIVQLIVTNEHSCTDTAYDTILVHLDPIVPSGFSPDGNGENDILYVLGGPFSKLEFAIYNEWGEVIFISDKQERGWNGTKDGIEQPIGVYVYTLVATAIDGNEHKLWGDVTLLR